MSQWYFVRLKITEAQIRESFDEFLGVPSSHAAMLHAKEVQRERES